MSRVKVMAFWDAEADVWVASSDDVPGLNVESGDWPSLLADLDDLVPEMLTANGSEFDDNLELEIEAKYVGPVHRLAA